MGNSEERVKYRSAGGIVLDESGDQVLLLIRPSRDEVRLPKGHIERDEEPVAAALREVQEETGYGDLEVIADLGELMVTFLLDENEIDRTERYFLMRIKSPERTKRPPADEKQFFTVWVPWSELEEHLTFEAEREWVKRARRAWESIR